MAAQKRYYSKGVPLKEPKEVSCSESHLAKDDENVVLPYTGSRYHKQDKEEPPLAFVVVFSGGTEREKDYLSPLMSGKKKFPNIRLEFMANELFLEKGEPAVFNYAFQKQQVYTESSNPETPDLYFLLTDVDDFGEWITKKIPKCNERKINVLVSNPCFEVWLYYATKHDKFHSFPIPDNYKQISQEVKTWCGAVVKGGLRPNRYLYCLEENIINAKKNYRYNPQTLYGDLFSTNVYELGEAILPFIKQELAKYKKWQAEKEYKYSTRKY